MIRKFKIKNLKLKKTANNESVQTFGFMNFQLYGLRSGFSLFETLLYLSLLTILVGGLISFMFIMVQTNIKVKTISTVDNEAHHALKLMTQYIRNTQLVNMPIVNGGSDTLSLNVFDTPNSPAVFSLVDGALVLSEGGNGAIAVTSSALKITNLSFVNLAVPNSKSSIKISFKANSQTTSVKQEYNYGKTYEAVASLRN